MKTDKRSKAIIHSLYEHPMSGEEIEERSFQIIDQEAPGHEFSPDQWEVVRRMIHTTADFGLIREVKFSSGSIFCHVADEDVAQEARGKGLPRSLFAVQKARRVLHGAIAVFGNAPVALMELNRLIMEEDVRPALVVAMPVGFVHVTESKQELMSLDVPFIAVAGRRGGSPLAVSTLHALCSVALGRG
jgi:precorrin-8X/cobalt-precorrin-8 methylmutase